MQRKYLALTISIILCLGATLFLIRQATSQTPGQYDPWLDTNGNGKVDVTDIAYVAKAFGSSGDPTRNVNVTNWPAPYLIQTVSLNCTFTELHNNSEIYYYGGYSITPFIYVGGYSRMWIHLIPPNPNATTEYTIANYSVTNYAVGIDWITDPSSSFLAFEGIGNIQSMTYVNVSTLRSPPMYYYGESILNNPIEIKSPFLRLTLKFYTAYFDDPGWMNMTVKIYLRNE